MLTVGSRDSEESAPAEYPPDQPEADNLDDDSNVYGVEETELEAALVNELKDTEEPEPKGEDHEMEGAEPTAGEEEEISDGESEDIEDESDDDEEELEEEEGGEGEDDVEMGDDSEQKDEQKAASGPQQQQADIMVHWSDHCRVWIFKFCLFFILNDLRFGLERFHDIETCSKPAIYPRPAALYMFTR